MRYYLVNEWWSNALAGALFVCALIYLLRKR